MTRKHWLLMAIVLLVFAGIVRAQDGGDGGDDPDTVPIQPAQPVTPTPLPSPTQPSFLPSPTPTIGLGEQVVIPTSAATEDVDALDATEEAAVATEEVAETEEADATSVPPVAFTQSPFTPGPTVEPTPPPTTGIVDVESAFIRAAPSLDSPPSASAFRDDVLLAIGRNLDGKFFEVARPYRPEESLGWVSIEVIDYEFLPERLPLTDIETGVQGDNPLASPVDYGVFVVEGVALRSLPSIQSGDRLLNIPPSVVVPVLGRYRDGEWLLVNYLGTEGWIIGFATRQRDDILTVTEIDVPLPGGEVSLQTEIISPEVQMAQLERARDYATSRTNLARDIEAFWWLVQQGEVMPCDPPPPVEAYFYSTRDVIELPELDRYIPRMNEGIVLLNESVDVLDQCGVIDPRTVIRARNDAINAKVILDNTLVQLDNLEDIIESVQ